VSSPSRAEHFVAPILIEFLQVQGSEASSDGFVELAQIYAFAQGIGFSVDSTSGGLVRALNARFITRSGFDRRSREQGRAYRVASCGLYVARKLAGSFAYLDAVIDATPIVDSGFFSTLQPMSHGRDLVARLRRSERFIDYLNQSWQSLGSVTTDVTFNWDATASNAIADIRAIRERLQR
jgi:hypothetical protein